MADLVRPRLGTVLAALCVTEIVSWGLLCYAFPVLAPRIGADTGWSPVAVTSAFSAALVVSALSDVLVGRVIDRHGPRRVMAAGSGLGVVALVVIAASPGVPVFVGGWVLAGAAMAGVLYPPAFAAITGWFTETTPRRSHDAHAGRWPGQRGLRAAHSGRGRARRLAGDVPLGRPRCWPCSRSRRTGSSCDAPGPRGSVPMSPPSTGRTPGGPA